ncbi:MAG: hypothetical protein JXA21_02345 [Anaerolineae bacterium]|nr:hypothetical protein [Anaerolineae bacterium]
MMTPTRDFYFESLYPFQNRALQVITDLGTGVLPQWWHDGVSWLPEAIPGAQEKAAGIFFVDLARLLFAIVLADWKTCGGSGYLPNTSALVDE